MSQCNILSRKPTLRLENRSQNIEQNVEIRAHPLPDYPRSICVSSRMKYLEGIAIQLLVSPLAVGQNLTRFDYFEP